MGWMASFKRHDEDQDDDAPPNPWVKLLDSFYPGRNPQVGEEIDSSSAFPAQERQGWKLETPIDHSITKAINAIGKHIIPILPMMYLSKNGRGELNASEESYSKTSGSEANNHINGLRIRRQLAAQQASSIFTKNGGLRQDIIDRSLLVVESKNLRNKDLISELEAMGGNISDWAKYKTPLISGPAGRFEMHFYRNSVTEEVYYGRDYKAVLEHQGKWNSELKPVFEYEPTRFGK